MFQDNRTCGRHAVLLLLEQNEDINRQQLFSAHLAQRSHSLRASVLWKPGTQDEAIAATESALEQGEIRAQ